MLKQVVISIAAAILSPPISFLLISHAYQAFHPVQMAQGSGGEVIQSGLVLGFNGAPVGAALVFILTLYLTYRYDHNADEDEQPHTLRNRIPVRIRHPALRLKRNKNGRVTLRL